MDSGVSDSFGGFSLTRCTPPWRSERADVIISAPLQGRLILSIAVSMVTGRFMLKPDLTTTNYIFILVGSEFFFLAGMSREGTRRHD